MKKLKPCPFCGNHRLSFITGAATPQFAVLCEECGQTSGWWDTQNKAIEEWNRRAKTQNEKT